VTDTANTWSVGNKVCAAAAPGATFAVPENGRENAALLAAHPVGVSDVWVNYSDAAAEGYWEVNTAPRL
jgi:hypothetical protein